MTIGSIGMKDMLSKICLHRKVGVKELKEVIIKSHKNIIVNNMAITSGELFLNPTVNPT